MPVKYAISVTEKCIILPTYQTILTISWFRRRINIILATKKDHFVGVK